MLRCVNCIIKRIYGYGYGYGSLLVEVRRLGGGLRYLSTSHVGTAMLTRSSLCPSVRPSVRLSRSGILSKWLNVISSYFLQHVVAYSF